MYERKQNGEDFFSLLAVTCFRFGNCTANGLVTEQPQYSVVVCFFSTWQNTEIPLISNGLRFIYTCSLLLALPYIFHVARHTAATVVFLANEVSMENVAKILGHSNIRMTQHYAKVLDTSILRDMGNVERNFSKRQI